MSKTEKLLEEILKQLTRIADAMPEKKPYQWRERFQRVM
jgi:hypothetical protein